MEPWLSQMLSTYCTSELLLNSVWYSIPRRTILRVLHTVSLVLPNRIEPYGSNQFIKTPFIVFPPYLISLLCFLGSCPE